jgi:hypothetical protein
VVSPDAEWVQGVAGSNPAVPIHTAREVRIYEKGADPPKVTRKAETSVMARCLAAARLQARAHDELAGAPSPLQYSARDAGYVSICKTMPCVFLPELR